MAHSYTWTNPVTDRTSGQARMTYIDMNRITQNLAWLYEECVDQGITIAGSMVSKRTWVQNDIITLANWQNILTCLQNVCDAVSYNAPSEPDDTMIYTNINNVELIEYACYDILSAYDKVPNMNHYVGDKLGTSYLYAGDPFNAGGRYE